MSVEPYFSKYFFKEETVAEHSIKGEISHLKVERAPIKFYLNAM